MLPVLVACGDDGGEAIFVPESAILVENMSVYTSAYNFSIINNMTISVSDVLILLSSLDSFEQKT